MKFLFILLLCFTMVFPALAAQPTLGWSQTYGGETDDYCYDVHPAYDYGFMLAGKSINPDNGDLDFLLVRTNADGSQRWLKRYGGSLDEWCHTVEYIPESNGWICAGFTESYGPGTRAAYFVRIAANGDTLWTRTYGGAGRDVIKSIKQTADGGFVAVGSSNSFNDDGYDETYVVRLEADGDTLWTNTFFQADWGNDIVETSDGNFIIAGGGYQGIVSIKVNSSGYLQYAESFSGNYSQDAGGITILPSGDVFIGGYAANYGDNPGSMYGLKLTETSGDSIWTRARGGAYNEVCYDALYSVNDDTYVLAGYTTSSGQTETDPTPYLLAFSSNGNVAWTGRYDTDNPTECRAVSRGPEYSYILGCTTYGDSDADMMLMYLEPDETGIENDVDGELPNAFDLSNAYPNPFNATTRLSLTLPQAGQVQVVAFNILGSEVASLADGHFEAGRHNLVLNANHLPSGIYYIQAKTSFGSMTRKVHLLK